MEFFGIGTEGLPTVRIAQQGANGFEKYKDDFELTFENIVNFLKSYL